MRRAAGACAVAAFAAAVGLGSPSSAAEHAALATQVPTVTMRCGEPPIAGLLPAPDALLPAASSSGKAVFRTHLGGGGLQAWGMEGFTTPLWFAPTLTATFSVYRYIDARHAESQYESNAVVEGRRSWRTRLPWWHPRDSRTFGYYQHPPGMMIVGLQADWPHGHFLVDVYVRGVWSPYVSPSVTVESARSLVTRLFYAAVAVQSRSVAPRSACQSPPTRAPAKEGALEVAPDRLR